MRGAPHITCTQRVRAKWECCYLRSNGFRRFRQGVKPAKGLRGFELDPEMAALAGSGFAADFSVHALGGGVAKNPLRSLVPARDGGVKVLADDRVVG